MSLERITKSILDDAEKEAARILHAAQAAIQRKIASVREELKKNLIERLKDVEVEIEEKKAIELSNLRTSYRQQILEIKNTVIDDVFKRAVQQIVSLSDERYLSIIEKWLQAISTTGQIFISSKDSKRITYEFISRINQSRKESSSLSLSKDFANISGGFMLKTEKFEIDHSLEAISLNLRERLGPKIAKELFREQTW
ncbi:MAG TPA: V-type ATP synthase subunit E [Candidatus Brocadiia bacterium]|nr:V-type ATP synthase subunit E [Candidatus Brocadiales bacterium]